MNENLPPPWPHTGFTASDLTALLQADVRPGVLRRLLVTYRDRDAWLAAPLQDWEQPEWRDLQPVEPDCQAVLLGDPCYPYPLETLSAPPPVLYVLGELEALRPALGVIGSRDIAALGTSVAAAAVRVAQEQGIDVVSGLARGVDEAAHRGALELGVGTFGFLPASFDACSDREAALISDILDAGGAVAAELPPGTPVSNASLMARNRLVAAFSHPLVVAQAEVRSGTTAAVLEARRIDAPIITVLPRAGHENTRGAHGLRALAGSLGEKGLRDLGWPKEATAAVLNAGSAVNGFCSDSTELRDAVRIFHLLAPRDRAEVHASVMRRRARAETRAAKTGSTPQ